MISQKLGVAEQPDKNLNVKQELKEEDKEKVKVSDLFSPMK